MLLMFALFIIACSVAEKTAESKLESGKQLAFSRSKGNCLACHVIADGELPGNIGPELKEIKRRFKDKKDLRAFIWDATEFNSETVMPPFGRNKILSEQEIDTIVDYLWNL